MNITFRPYNNSSITTNNSKNSNKNFSNVSFGENEEANNKVKGFAKLTHNDYLLKQQELCSQMEKDIRAGNFPKDKIDTFIHLKTGFVKTVEMLAPAINLAESEIKDYTKEIEELNGKLNTASNDRPKSKNAISVGKKEIESLLAERRWRTDLCEEITDILEPKGCNVGGYGGEPLLPGQNDAPPTKEFKPNAFSPKGFKDIAGQNGLKEEFISTIIDPVKNPETIKLNKEYGIQPYSSYLLYGPPGCGKTMLVEALAQEAKLPLFKLKISELGSIYIHETSMRIRQAFDTVEEKINQTGQPCILFIDEIEGLTPSREMMGGMNENKTEEIDTFLDLLNNAKDRKIIVIAATNQIDFVDSAIKRTGRFDKKILVDKPGLEDREAFLKLHLSKVPKASDILNNEENIKTIAKRTEGLTFSDFKPVLEDAGKKAKYRKDNITLSDVLSSIEEYEKRKMAEAGFNTTSEESSKAAEVAYI